MTIIPFIGYSLYQMALMFCFWAFIGWCIEVCYMTIETGEYQNRGFLSMPICPIYGFGVLMIAVFSRPIADKPLLLFVISLVLCTALELAVGLGMEKLFNTRWWDYSHEKFNYRGYICPKVSILWGLGCVLVIKVVQPLVEAVVNHIPFNVGIIFICIMAVLIAIDLTASLCAVANLNKRLKQIDDISALMLKGSIKIGEKLANETNEILDKYEKLLAIRDRQTERFLRAFPNIRSVTHSESMEALKQKYYSNRFAKKLEVKLKKQLAVLKRKGKKKPQETAEEVPAAPAMLPEPDISENVQPETENESELEPAAIGK
ncbi:MAG: putative ABC transporter permease [Oscillospiraceae bacterium]|nr:putative ABC transporter permease [Oscillospiraceae bacterium]